MKLHLKEYESLIEKAEYSISLIKTSTAADRGIGFDYYESIQYNGYDSPEYFKAKLKSLMCLIEFDLSLELSIENKYPLKFEPTITEKLVEYKSYFTISNYKTFHINTLIKNEIKNYQLNEKHLLKFIEIAHYSVLELYHISIHQKPFFEIFRSNKFTMYYNFSFVKEALYNLGITDCNGNSSLGDREKILLWYFIDALIENGIIISTLNQEDYMLRFWGFIKGKGAAPKKPHRHKNVPISKQKLRISNFMKDFYK